MPIPQPSQTPEEKEDRDSSPEDLATDEWFVNGERTSSAPPSSRRATVMQPSAPPEPIGDQLADVWFR